jgi:hypothetical protein
MTPQEIDDQAQDNPTAEDATPSGIDPDEWITLREVLRGTEDREPIPIAQVVTDIEDGKCFFRDPFGRTKKITDAQIEMVRAALEKFDQYEQYPDLYGGHPPIDPDTSLEDLTDFGWPGDKVPTFQTAPSDSDRPLRESERQRLYRTIYTLAGLVAERSEKFRKASGLNVDQLAEKCSEFHTDPDGRPPRGYSKSTFRAAIDEAIKACKEELDEL